MVPFLIAAGATQYPRGKFLAALVIGRSVRYTILGLLGYLYGRWILTVMRQHVYAIIGVGAILVVGSVTLAFLRLRHDSPQGHPSRVTS
jgi:membrane protein DedA with SNARE-associated domain